MILKGWRRWYQERQVIKELEKLDDKELHDIGINRSMIRQAVKKNMKVEQE